MQNELNQQAIAKRLLYIMHLAFVEARNLALSANQPQLADLADTFETLPRFVEACDEGGIEMIRFALKSYQEKYPKSPHSYLKRFEEFEPPERY